MSAVRNPLPTGVRARVVALAADALGGTAVGDVPASLVAVRRFTPARRARLGATPIAAALETDAGFRAIVAERVRLAFPDLVTALEEGDGAALPAAPPEDVAAVAYVLRLPGWEKLAALAEEDRERSTAAGAAAESAQVVRRLTDQLTTLRAGAKAEVDALRTQITAARAEADELRRRLRVAGETARRAENAAAAATRSAQETTSGTDAALREAQAENRRLRARVTEVETALSAIRRGARDARDIDDARLRVLLDTLQAAASGVRRELSLPAVLLRPADVAGQGGQRIDPFAGVGVRGLGSDDPGLVDDVLTVPVVHLIVDGYNVTKTGYGTMPLEDQRARLLRGMGALAQRTPEAELTVVFDATAVTDRPVGATPSPRGVRVVFSRAGELADQEIVRLVRAEPVGRPVAVVTSDREVVDAVRGAGAHPVASSALLARLERT